MNVYRIEPYGRECWLVTKECMDETDELTYVVDVEENTCFCQDFEYRGSKKLTCKHLCMCKRHRPIREIRVLDLL